MGISAAPKAFRVLRIVAGACVVALLGAVPARAAEPPTAKELYRQALVVMNDLKEPAFVTFRLEGVSEGMRVDWTTDNCDNVEVSHRSFTFGNNRVRWTLRHRTEDYKTEIVDSADGRRYVSNVDPTWLQHIPFVAQCAVSLRTVALSVGPRAQPADAGAERTACQSRSGAEDDRNGRRARPGHLQCRRPR